VSLLAALQNAEAGLVVSGGVIILTTFVPAIVLTVVIWIFVRASLGDPGHHPAPRTRREAGLSDVDAPTVEPVTDSRLVGY
jgi:hypothetical protein